MKIMDLFLKEGTKVPVGSNKPLLLDQTDSVWLVGKGKAIIYLITLTEDNKPGVKYFLFEVGEGQLLFGFRPEKIPNTMGILISGLAGSSLCQLGTKQLKELLTEESAEEFTLLVRQWLKNLEKINSQNNMGPALPTITEIAALAESQDIEADYLVNSSFRETIHGQVLRAAIETWEQQKRAEERRLQKKADNDQRMMANALSRLAAVNQEDKIIRRQETSGSALLDACRLVGQSMHIDIIAPPEGEDRSENSMDIDAIARASRMRTREVTLSGDWYRQDNGPILAFMKDDQRPIALIPSSPSRYMVHDFVQGTKSILDKDIASQIDYHAHIFYRSFGNNPVTLRDLWSFGFQSIWKRDLVYIALMGILGGLLGTAIPLATGFVFNSVIPESDKGQLLQIAFILVASALATLLFQFVRSVATLRMEGKMDGSLQAAVWDRLISLPVPFFAQFSAGELAMRAMGINRIRVLISGVTLNTILSSIFSIFNFALLFYYDIKLAGVAAILVGAAILIMGYLSYRKVDYERKVLDASNNIAGMMLQLIGGVTKFRVAGAENRAFFRWVDQFSKQRRMIFTRDTIGNILTTFNAVFPVLASLVIYYALTSEANSLSPGEFIGFNSAFLTFMISMVALSDSLIGASIVIPLYQRARPILETLPEDDETKADPRTLTGSIEVSHVSFRYKEDGPMVLQDVSLKINEGDYVAIVGASGCGKSTLFRILLGFEKPQTGTVYYNGQDLNKIDVRAVRRQLGVVLQNGQLMSGNILNNIIGANPRLTINDAWQAARMAGVAQDIEDMPMGMHTMICEGAGTISGGQKQRLMIARAIVNKPRIIFFDEATSALDNQTQSIVSQSLDGLQATRLVIAHRLSTIMNCNKIFVMDKGRIVESGSYQELIERQGLFADLARRQLA